MKWEKFDKKVNDELQEHQSEVDMDALWSAIEPEVDALNAEKKKRRRGVFWWFFGGALLIGIGAACLFFSQNEATQVADFKNKNEVAETVEGNEINDFDKNEAANFDNKDAEIIDEKTNPIADLNTQKAAVSNLKNEISTLNFNKNQLNANAEKLDENEFFNENKNLNKNENGERSINDFNQKSAALNLKNTSNFPENEAVENAANEVRNTNLTAFENQQLPAKDKNQLFQLPTALLKNINYPNADLTRTALTEEAVEAIEDDFNQAATDDEKQTDKTFKTAVSLQTGLGFAHRNLSGSIFDSGLIRLRDSLEKSLETVQVGLQLHWQHQKTGLELTSGINYTQINEKFEYKVNEITVDSIFGIESFYRNVNGDTIANMGMIPQTTTLNIHQRHFNQYRMLDVPVLLGYRKQLDKFSIGAQAGVFVNLKLQTAGRILENATDDIDIQKANIFKANVGLSYYLGATIDYHLTKNWSVSAAPFVRYFPNNFAKASYGIEQKYTLYGVNLGLRYSF